MKGMCVRAQALWMVGRLVILDIDGLSGGLYSSHSDSRRLSQDGRGKGNVQNQSIFRITTYPLGVLSTLSPRSLCNPNVRLNLRCEGREGATFFILVVHIQPTHPHWYLSQICPYYLPQAQITHTYNPFQPQT